MTNDLQRRGYEHKNALISGFTQQYGLKNLIWYEAYEDIEQAIIREKQLKKWNRAWKIELIEKSNPKWRDLYELL